MKTTTVFVTLAIEIEHDETIDPLCAASAMDYTFVTTMKDTRLGDIDFLGASTQNPGKEF